MLRIIVAAVVGWEICRWIDPGSLPIYAVLVPLIAMRDDPYSAFNTSFDRLLGVLAGIAIGVLVSDWLGPSVYAVSLVLLVGLVGGIVLRIGSNLNAQVSLSALLVFANPNPGQVARQLSDLGVLVAHADRHVPRVVALHDAAQETEHRAEELPLKLAGAQRSVRYNPLRHRHHTNLAAMAEPVGLVVSLAQAVRVLVEDAAAHELERWRAAAQAPLDAVLRRPAYRVVHALEAFDR